MSRPKLSLMDLLLFLPGSFLNLRNLSEEPQGPEEATRRPRGPIDKFRLSRRCRTEDPHGALEGTLEDPLRIRKEPRNIFKRPLRTPMKLWTTLQEPSRPLSSPQGTLERQKKINGSSRNLQGRTITILVGFQSHLTRHDGGGGARPWPSGAGGRGAQVREP